MWRPWRKEPFRRKTFECVSLYLPQCVCARPCVCGSRRCWCLIAGGTGWITESWEINDSTLPSHLLSNLWPSGCSSNLLLVSPHLLRLLPILFFSGLGRPDLYSLYFVPLLSSESHPSDFPPLPSPSCLSSYLPVRLPGLALVFMFLSFSSPSPLDSRVNHTN